MRFISSSSFNSITIINKKPDSRFSNSRKSIKTSAVFQLPDIWKRVNSLSRKLPYNQVSKSNIDCNMFDFSLANQNDYYHDFLVPQANQLCPFISQAISSIAVKKMTLGEIENWLRENVKKIAKAKEIQLCLENCSIFTKVIHNGIVYWQLEHGRLKLHSFGQNILDTGVAGGIEFWQGKHPMMSL